MSLPKPALIQAFLDEKRRNKELERHPLLSDDNLSNEYEKYNLNKEKCKKRKNKRKPAAEPPREFNADSEGSIPNRSSNESDSGERASDSTASLNTVTDSKNFKVSLSTKEKLGTNYGGTSTVEGSCADVLASYGSVAPKQAVGIGGKYKHTALQQRNRCESTKKSHKNPRKFIESEEYVGENLSSCREKNREDRNSSSDDSPNSRRSSVSFESDHCHELHNERSEKDEKKRRKAMKKLMIATALSFCFMIGEVVGGYLANSLAIMTDASHLLTDVSSFMISIVALKMASRPVSKKMTFGWHRAEVIGALISVLAIWIVTGVLVYLAIMRLVTNTYRVDGENMLITAGLAVGFNIVMGLVLHEHHGHHGHSHGHSHGHDHDHESGSKGSHSDEDSGGSGNVNVRAAFIHVIGDLLQSIGVLTAAFVIYFKPEYKIADPICTFLFSLFVLITTITILRDTIVIIMEGSPLNIEYNVVKQKLLDIDGIVAVHDLRLWSLTLNQTVMTAHLVINKLSNPNAILKRATRRLKSLYEFHSLTLQVEYYSDDMDSCKRCLPA